MQIYCNQVFSALLGMDGCTFLLSLIVFGTTSETCNLHDIVICLTVLVVSSLMVMVSK